MSMQWIMRWGHDFPKDNGVGMLTLSMFGENPCVMQRTHQNYQTTLFLVFSSQPFILPEGGWGSYCLEGEEYGKFWIGQSQFWNVVFCLHGQENTRTICQFWPTRSRFGFTLTFGELQNILVHWSLFTTIFVSQECDIMIAAELYLCVSFAFCECLVTLW